MFEIDEIVSVELIDNSLLVITHGSYELRMFYLDEIATMSLPLVSDAIVNPDNYRFYVDSQGYLVITHKEIL